METVERYVYAVTKRLPLKQRADTARELRSLIEDMLQEQTGESTPTEKDIRTVLTELGSPNKLADSYNTTNKYLIGPAYYDTYLLIIKIVLASVTFGLSLAIIIDFIGTPPASLFAFFAGFLLPILSAVLQAFAWVTIIFFILERFFVSSGREFDEDKEFDFGALPTLPDKNIVIRPTEAVFGLLFAIIVATILNYAPHIIGVYFASEKGLKLVASLFDSTVLRSALPLINIMLFLAVLKELLKLITGRWSKSLATANALFNAACFALFFFFMRQEGLFNEKLFTLILNKLDEPLTLSPAALAGKVACALVVLVGFGLALDAILNLIKAWRYQPLD